MPGYFTALESREGRYSRTYGPAAHLAVTVGNPSRRHGRFEAYVPAKTFTGNAH